VLVKQRDLVYERWCIKCWFSEGKIGIFGMCNGQTNAIVCNKTLIQMSHIKTLKITPTCFDHKLIIIRELFDPS
jgi:hypothetical protein